jgi:hypothetical protein
MPKLFDGTSLPLADTMAGWTSDQLFTIDCYGTVSEFVLFDMFVDIDAPTLPPLSRQVMLKYTNQGGQDVSEAYLINGQELWTQILPFSNKISFYEIEKRISFMRLQQPSKNLIVTIKEVDEFYLYPMPGSALDTVQSDRLWSAYVGTMTDSPQYSYSILTYRLPSDLNDQVLLTTRSKSLVRGKVAKQFASVAQTLERSKLKKSRSRKARDVTNPSSMPGDLVIQSYGSVEIINAVLESLFIDDLYVWQQGRLVATNALGEPDESIQVDARIANGYTSFLYPRLEDLTNEDGLRPLLVKVYDEAVVDPGVIQSNFLFTNISLNGVYDVAS